MGGVSEEGADGRERVRGMKVEEGKEAEVNKEIGCEVTKYSAELFRTLCQLTTGEANTVVRGSEQ